MNCAMHACSVVDHKIDNAGRTTVNAAAMPVKKSSGVNVPISVNCMRVCGSIRLEYTHCTAKKRKCIALLCIFCVMQSIDLMVQFKS